MNPITRRTFIKSAAFTAAAFSLPRSPWARVPGANDEIRIAIVGFNGQGKSHIGSIADMRKKGEKVRITALCVVDEAVLGKVAQEFKDKNEPVQTYTDIRKLLENPEIDAVSIATPNHWHALMTIWACQAGKDVYVEKPVCHNVWEGRQMIRAARAHKRIVQAGTQSRSSSGIREAVAWVNEGHLGKILISRGLCYKPRQSIGKVSAPQRPPASVDYDLWCGPAPMTPLMRNRLHYDWHWVWPTGNGDLGNQGIHQMDIARWFLGVDTLSPRVFSVGGRLGYSDDGETPNTQFIFHDYARAPLSFEVRGLPSRKDFQLDGKQWGENMDSYLGARIGVIVECENGRVLVPNYTGAVAIDKEGKELKRFQGAENHHGNFFKAMRTRKAADLNADIHEGFVSSALCHTGNISYRLGKQSNPAEIRERVKADRDATATFDRMAAHLEANGVDCNSEAVILGAFLKMDVKKEKFIRNKAADRLLTRDYRKPFAVPTKV